MSAFFANQTSITTFRAFVLGSFVVLCGLIAGAVSGSRVSADIAPKGCSGKTSVESNPCGASISCPGSACSGWFSPEIAVFSLQTGKSTDNYMTSLNELVECGAGSYCYLDDNDNCIPASAITYYVYAIINGGFCVQI